MVAVVSTLIHEDHGELGMYPDSRDLTQLTKLRAKPKYLVTLQYDYPTNVFTPATVRSLEAPTLSQPVTSVQGDFLAVVMRHTSPFTPSLKEVYQNQGKVLFDEDGEPYGDPYPLTPTVQDDTTYSIPAIKKLI